MTASPAAHRHFHDELSELKQKLLTLSGEAQEALGRAVQALLERDGVLARCRALMDLLEMKTLTRRTSWTGKSVH